MKPNRVKITEQEYIERNIPVGPWLTILKDYEIVEKVEGSEHLRVSEGGIYYANERTNHLNFSSTGVILKKSPFEIFETPEEKAMFDLLKEGDRVGFSISAPFASPCVPYWHLEGEHLDEDKYLMLYVCDIRSVLASDKKQIKEIMKRKVKNG